MDRGLAWTDQLLLDVLEQLVNLCGRIDVARFEQLFRHIILVNLPKIGLELRMLGPSFPLTIGRVTTTNTFLLEFHWFRFITQD